MEADFNDYNFYMLNFYYYDKNGHYGGYYWYYSQPTGICISARDKLIDTKNFTLDADGVITAKNANIKGEIYAETVSARNVIVTDVRNKSYTGITANITYRKDDNTTGTLSFINGILVECT